MDDDRNDDTAGGRGSQDEALDNIGMISRPKEEDHRMRQRIEKMKDMVLMQMQMEIKLNEMHTIRMVHMGLGEHMTEYHPRRTFSV